MMRLIKFVACYWVSLTVHKSIISSGQLVVNWGSVYCVNSATVKFLNLWMPENFAVIVSK